MEEAPQRSLAFLLDKKREIYFSTGFERAFFDRITRGVGKMFGGELTVGVGLIRGLGFGLTPSGDDFLAGLLLGLNLREIIYGEHLRGFIAHVYETARGGSVFSDMLLALADKGLFTEHFKKLICAMLEGDRREILVASRRVLSQGETSGADTATGFMMALKMGHLLCY